MSLRAFQRAVVDLTLSYQKVRALQDGDAAWLASYELTPLEQARIRAIVSQSGMAVHCTLARGNRLEAVFNTFPMTCVLLESRLRPLMNELWADRQPTNYQLAGEDTAFAAFIGVKIASGELSVEYLPEILAYEAMCLKLTTERLITADPDATVEGLVDFQHLPDDVLQPLARLVVPPAGLPPGSYPSKVTLRHKRFEVEVLSPPLNSEL